ncbi:MAG: DNA-3-methyladenine glycosylase [Chloroflexota bacterium]|nr:MAG: DNA-3-methyladenine glycosylase [Chloroflexota bacterium]
MPETIQIGRDFFNLPTLEVARSVLGKRLVRLEDGRRIAGIIVEAEAYRGEEDQGCHAKAGLTPRTRVMYGLPGHAYVYFTYGMHWMLNFVTEPQGFPAAVLIRALKPVEGIETIASRREGRPPAQWTDGPGKICQALGIDRRLNGADMCLPGAELFLEDGPAIPDSSVTITPRVGLNTVPEPWKSIPWRFVFTHPPTSAFKGEGGAGEI